MIIQQLVFPMVLVGLPNANDYYHLSKPDYTIQNTTCQENYNNTLEHNYITTPNLIEKNIQKYQDLLW